jgi:PKD repeat protein
MGMDLSEGEKPGREGWAISEVVGTIILVGVVMIGITIVGILLFSNPPSTKVPSFNAIISNQSKTIYIYHKGGDPLQSGEFKIFVDGTDRTSSFVNNGNDPWSVGETLSYTSPTMPLKVVIVWIGTGKGPETVMMGSELRPVSDIPSHPQSPPLVSWTSNRTFGNTSTPFKFTDSSTGKNITLYYWDLGDGNTTNTKSPDNKLFPCNTGFECSYSILHSVTDSAGTNWESTSWDNRSGWVTMYKNITPNVTFTQDKTTGPAGLLSIQFTATKIGNISIDRWDWDFGDTGTATSQNPSHTYTTKGIYTVKLTATNYTLGWDRVIRTNLVLVTEPWYNCAWHYRKNITIDKNQVAATLPNFPVLVSFTDSDLSARAQGDGDDILFTTSTGTKLSHEIESYDGTGALNAWVKLTSLPNGSNTTIFMYYGNSGVGSQQDVANVWDANYVAVWHLKEAGSGALGEYKDSKNTNHGQGGGGTGAQVPTQTTGQINRSQQFDNNNDWIDAKSAASVDDIFANANPGGTFSAWIRPTSVGENSEGRIGDKSSTATSCDGGWCFSTYTGPELRFRKGFSGSSSVDGIWSTAAGTISTAGVWQYVAVTYNQGATTNDPIIYINGASKALTETTPVGTAQSDAAINLVLGNYAGGQTRTFDGKIDEIRASKSIRDGNWILTEYRNQNSPSTFHYRMAEEPWTC